MHDCSCTVIVKCLHAKLLIENWEFYLAHPLNTEKIPTNSYCDVDNFYKLPAFNIWENTFLPILSANYFCGVINFWLIDKTTSSFYKLIKQSAPYLHKSVLHPEYVIYMQVSVLSFTSPLLDFLHCIRGRLKSIWQLDKSQDHTHTDVRAV